MLASDPDLLTQDWAASTLSETVPGSKKTFTDTSAYATEWEGQSHFLVYFGKTLPLAELFSSL